MVEPATWGLRRRALDVLHDLHIARPAVRLYELGLATRSLATARGASARGDLPLPPARLRVQAGPRHADAAFFLRSGRHHAELLRNLLHAAGSPIEELDAILDWGCGCGRVLRHWSGLAQTAVKGCDINPKMVEWCQANLPFASVRLTDIAPSLPYEEGSLDLVYAFSVMTHLPEELQRAWMRECRRVLKPGGHLLFSTLGEHYLSLGRLSESERGAFRRGELVVLYDDEPGTSLCSAYHPEAYVRQQLARDFDVKAFLAAADDGRHDLYLLQRPS
jgi:SAM-dependent methyltransferase